MSIDQKIIAVNDLAVEVIKKDIKNIHVAVCPPNGRVRVATPLKVEDETVKQIVITKMAWIKKQQKKFDSQERQTKREYVSGESHYFMGNRYRLNVVPTEENPRIEIKRKARIDMYIKPGASVEKREESLDAFYRQALKKQIPQLLAKWEEKTGLKASEIRIKKMKTKWGTCNPKKERIWLNLELAKKPARCIEYVFVHELVHLIEKNHTEKFNAILKQFLPNWLQIKAELNKIPLGYSEWSHSTKLLYDKERVPTIDSSNKKKVPAPDIIVWKQITECSQEVQTITYSLINKLSILTDASSKVSGKNFVLYNSKNRFAAFMPRRYALAIRIRTNSTNYPDSQSLIGEKIYHWFFNNGAGEEREFRIVNLSQVDYAFELIKRSYELASGP